MVSIIHIFTPSNGTKGLRIIGIFSHLTRYLLNNNDITSP